MMTPAPRVKVQTEDFDLQKEIDDLTGANSNIGAVVSFCGLCRDEQGTLDALELEHYPGMAEAEMTRLAEEAIKRWSLDGVSIIHRHGKITPGDNIVLVLTASVHRQAAFEAASFLMDFMKSKAPFWKRELLKDGQIGSWVDAREADDDALERWQ